jgi:outer membrane receptor protein involved in Fe transport
MKRGSFGCLALVALTAFTMESPARADDTAELRELLGQTVVSTASKSAELGHLAPATTSSISADDLRRYGVRSLAEAINFLSLGMTASDRLLGTEVGARGVLLNADYDNHVLLLLNGHAINEQWGGTAVFDRGAGIPLEIVDHIEVTLGPGSVMYGSTAMLGIVNVVTKRAAEYKGFHLLAEGEIATSIRGGAGAGFEFKLFGQPSEATIQLEYLAQRGPTFHFGPQPYGLDSVSGQPKNFGPYSTPGVWGGDATQSFWTAAPSAVARLSIGNLDISAHFSRYRRSQPGLDVVSVPKGDFNAENNYESDQYTSLDVSHHVTLSDTIELRSRVYGDLYTYHWWASTTGVEDCDPIHPTGCRQHLEGAAQWAGAEIQPSFDWLHDGSVVTMLGVDGRLRRVQSTTEEFDPAETSAIQFDKQDHLEPAIGIYGQQTFQPTKWLGLSAGARGDIDPRYHAVHVSPRAAATVSPWRGGTVRAIYSEAFRAPSSFETYYVSVQQNWARNPDLKPEVVRNIEASFEQRIGSQRLFVGVFRSWWSDMILFQTLTGADLAKVIADGNLPPGTTSGSQYQNVGTIDNYGFNAAYDGVIAERLRYGLAVTGAYSRRALPDGSTNILTVAPSVFGNARIAYDFGGALPTVALAGQLIGPRAADRAIDGGFTPTPYVGTAAVVRATITGQVPGVTGLSYRLSGNVASNARNPYVIGPNQAASAAQPAAELSPIDQLRFSVGLRYDGDFTPHSAHNSH